MQVNKFVLLLLLSLHASFAVAFPSIQISKLNSRTQIASIRTPEGLHRFELKQKSIRTLVSQNNIDFVLPTLFAIKSQRGTNTSAAASKIDHKLSIVFLGRRTKKLYTATIECNENQKCAARVRRVASSVYVRCALLNLLNNRSTQALEMFSANSPSREISLAVHLDHQFVRKLGVNSEATAIEVLNAAEGIFLSQLGLHIRITTIERISADNEKLTSSNAEELLDQYSKFLTRARTLQRANLHHLLTGKDLFVRDFTTGTKLEGIVGLAFLGSICTTQNQTVSLAQLTAAQLGLRVIISAHEIAHNLNATHPEESGLPSQSAGLMSAVVKSGNSTFSQFSINEVNLFLNQNGACLASRAPQVDVTQITNNKNNLSFVINTESDLNETCAVNVYATTRKRMLSAQIKLNRAIRISQTTLTTPSSQQITVHLPDRFKNSTELYLRATIECPSGSGSSSIMALAS